MENVRYRWESEIIRVLSTIPMADMVAWTRSDDHLLGQRIAFAAFVYERQRRCKYWDEPAPDKGPGKYTVQYQYEPWEDNDSPTVRLYVVSAEDGQICFLGDNEIYWVLPESATEDEVRHAENCSEVGWIEAPKAKSGHASTA